MSRLPAWLGFMALVAGCVDVTPTAGDALEGGAGKEDTGTPVADVSTESHADVASDQAPADQTAPTADSAPTSSAEASANVDAMPSIEAGDDAPGDAALDFASVPDVVEDTPPGPDGSPDVLTDAGVDEMDADCPSCGLVALSIDPHVYFLYVGSTTWLHATGTYAGGSTRDLSSVVTWSVSDSSAIGNGPMLGGFLVGLPASSVSVVTATLGSFSATTNVFLNQPTPVSFEIAPRPLILVDATVPLEATAIFSDGMAGDVTMGPDWQASPVATISMTPRGEVVTGVSSGTGEISAQWGGFSDSFAIQVGSLVTVSLDVTPANSTIALGTSEQLVATGTFPDGEILDLTYDVTWASSDETRATVSSDGIISALGVGNVTLTATRWAVQTPVTLTVSPATLDSIRITPPTPTMSLRTWMQLIATGLLSDGSTQDLTPFVTWSSSHGLTVIPALHGGSVFGEYAGVSTVSATYGGVVGSTVVAVQLMPLSSIAITADPVARPGDPLRLHAIGHYLDGSTQDITRVSRWESSDTSVASVDTNPNHAGIVTGSSARSRSRRPFKA